MIELYLILIPAIFALLILFSRKSLYYALAKHAVLDSRIQFAYLVALFAYSFAKSQVEISGNHQHYRQKRFRTFEI